MMNGGKNEAMLHLPVDRHWTPIHWYASDHAPQRDSLHAIPALMSSKKTDSAQYVYVSNNILFIILCRFLEKNK